MIETSGLDYTEAISWKKGYGARTQCGCGTNSNFPI
jgi:hypothetical protein